MIYENLADIGSPDVDESRQSAYEVEKLIYRMNKRFINNHKRKYWIISNLVLLFICILVLFLFIKIVTLFI